MMKSGTRNTQNMGIRLAEQLHAQLEDILGEEIQVILFGSQARGDSTDESDVHSGYRA